MFDWIMANAGIVGSIVGAIVVVVLAAVDVMRRTGSVRQAILTAMLGAERARRQGTLPIDGPAVMERVISWALDYLVPHAPAWLRPFLTEGRLRNWAQTLYNGALDLLDDGALNGTRPDTENGD